MVLLTQQARSQGAASTDGAASAAGKVCGSMGRRGSCCRPAGGRRKIQKWWSYKIHTVAALVGDRRRSAADIEEAVVARIRRTGVYALLDQRNLLSRVTRL